MNKFVSQRTWSGTSMALVHTVPLKSIHYAIRPHMHAEKKQHKDLFQLFSLWKWIWHWRWRLLPVAASGKQQAASRQDVISCSETHSVNKRNQSLAVNTKFDPQTQATRIWFVLLLPCDPINPFNCEWCVLLNRERRRKSERYRSRSPIHYFTFPVIANGNSVIS